MEQKQSEKMTTLLRQREVDYSTLSTTPGQACANCRWFSGVDGSWCRIVESTPLDIMNTGYCNRWEVDPTTTSQGSALAELSEMAEMMGSAELDDKAGKKPPYGDKPGSDDDDDSEDDDNDDNKPDKKKKPAPKKSLLESAVDSVKSLFTRDEFGDGIGFKVQGNHWLIVWSNNFEDREGEIFTAKAIDDYVARVDAGIVPTPALVVWHVDGVSAKDSKTRIGDTEWVGRHEHFILAGGTFDDTPQGRAAQNYYSKQARKTKVSHGFSYDPRQFDGRHYEQFNTFEISLLPEGVEANRFTNLSGVKDMELTDKKRQYIADVFGESVAEDVLAKLSNAGEAIKSLDVAYKDFTQVNEPDVETEAKKEAVERVETQLKDLIPDLVDGQALTAKSSAAALNSVKALVEKVKALESDVAALKERAAAAPKRASDSKMTIINETDAPNLKKEIADQMTARDPFFGVEVKGDI